MEEALTALLLEDAGLAALVVDRVHWGRLPATVAGRPYVNLTVVGGLPTYHSKGQGGLCTSIVQADCWAESMENVMQVHRALEACLSGFSGIRDGINFRGIFVDAVRDLAGDTAGDERALFRRSVDLTINWRG